MTQLSMNPDKEYDCRFIVGIDLGTTNVAVSYVDLETDTELKQFPVLQLVAAGEWAEQPLLPSFCYLPAGPELPDGALTLPWNDHPGHAVGTFAREQGAAVPDRLVSSAKSWLAHAGVDRTRGILPWGSDLGDQNVSPVQVSAHLVQHVRDAWDDRMAVLRDRHGTPCTLDEQHVIVTVPASFDEVARELTVEAARKAGLTKLTLIEEPLAAFYAWLSSHEETWQQDLDEGQTVLVVDVGGGTTDFSLISIEQGFVLRRTAVGEHLLLGGDNIDMALARMAEAAWNTRLPSREWHTLCQQCRGVKEALLAPDAPDTAAVSVAGSGSAVVATTRTHAFARDEVRDLVDNGFFPALDTDSGAPERRGGIREMGLPYAADPAVTRHLLHFLRRSAPVMGQSPGELVAPSAVLFNGGAMLPLSLRQRVCRIVGSWNNDDPVRELTAWDLSLAVSRGAAYHGLVRRGRGVHVRGGLARAYYLEVSEDERTRLLCVMPRDSEEGTVERLDDHQFTVRTNQPVRFPIACSATRLGDRAGDLIDDREDVSELPSLHTALKYGRGSQTELDVVLQARLNAIGTLDISLESVSSEHVYPLVFDLRGTAEEDDAGSTSSVTLDEATLKAAEDTIRKTFEHDSDPKQLMRNLEEVLDMPKKAWDAVILRRLADRCLESAEKRLRTPDHEARWLNLTGFCLRPGFGTPGDEWRLGELWKLWHRGPGAAGATQVAAEWWVMWRRVAGGLRAGHQQQVGGGLMRDIVPKAGEKLLSGKRLNQEHQEEWRCLGALERLSIKSKLRILKGLLDDGRRLDDCHLWVMARVGARVLFHGPADAIIPAEKIIPFIDKLMELPKKVSASRMGLFAVVNTARCCGVRGLDLPAETRRRIADWVAEYNPPDEWLTMLHEHVDTSADFTAELVGDALPLGLAVEADKPKD